MVERIAQAVRESIMRGELVPGTPLRELDLREALGVSRNTVREALRLLSHEGLVQHDAYRSTTVTQLARQDIADIFKVRRAVEIPGALAAEHASAPQLQRLQAECDAYRAATVEEDWPTAFEHDMRLHATLASFLDSNRISRFFIGVLRELRLAYFMLGGFETEGLPRDQQQHADIVRLIEERSYRDAQAVLAEHLANSEALLLKLMTARFGEAEALEDSPRFEDSPLGIGP
jgi:DNA-binding GntR family transcriptional regulator